MRRFLESILSFAPLSDEIFPDYSPTISSRSSGAFLRRLRSRSARFEDSLRAIFHNAYGATIRFGNAAVRHSRCVDEQSLTAAGGGASARARAQCQTPIGWSARLRISSRRSLLASKAGAAARAAGSNRRR